MGYRSTASIDYVSRYTTIVEEAKRSRARDFGCIGIIHDLGAVDRAATIA